MLPMKIAISTDLYYPMINGVAMFSRNLAAGMTKRGHEVIVLAPSISGEFEIEEDKEGGFKVVRLTSARLPFYPDQISQVPEAKEIFGKRIPRIAYKNGLHVSFSPYYEIKEVLEKFQPDIIHNQTPGPVALAILRYAKKTNTPLVSTGHAYPDNFTSQLHLPVVAKKPLDAAIRSYFASFLKKSEYATMPTELAIADLLPKRRKKFHVPIEALSNGIDLSRFKPGKSDEKICKKHGIDSHKPIVLYVGRIDPEKSLDILIKAVPAVVAKVPDVQFVIVGDGSAKNKLQDLAEDLDVAQNVNFTGKVVGEELPKIYQAGDVFAITSTTETQSIVLMEAMASGLPAIAVHAGAVTELVKNGKNGFLCVPNDTDAVAKRIIEILSDDSLKKKMGKMSTQLIKKHDIGYTLKRMEEIYQQVIASHPRDAEEEE